jgi:hypothetical protein
MMWDEIVEETINNAGPSDGWMVEEFKGLSSQVQCFEITNIFEWVVDYEENHDEKPDVGHCKPPCPSWFMDFKAVDKSRVGIWVSTFPMVKRMKSMIEGSVTKAIPDPDEFMTSMFEETRKAGEEKTFKQILDDEDYFYKMDLYLKGDTRSIFRQGFFIFSDRCIKKMSVLSPMGEENVEGAKQVAALAMNMLLYFLLFVNAKNITIQTFRRPDDKINKKRGKNGKPPLAIYKVLTIDPSKVSREFLPRMTGRGMEGLRYHFCRGHIKSYTEDSPLFGKFSGTWFWSPTMRGKKSAGEVHKTYRVEIDGKGGGDGREKEGRDSSDG